MLDIFNNKIAFLKIKPKLGFLIVIFIIVILLTLVSYMNKVEVYDHYQAKGIVSCTNICTITTAIPTNLDFSLITINNKNLKYEIIKKELKANEQNYTTYYEMVLSTSNNLNNNEIVDLNFYYNKQRIITKIKNKMC